MNYSTNKTLFMFAVIIGGSSAVVFFWAGYPKETMTENLVLFANALGFWFVTSAIVFVMYWVFVRLIGAFLKYIWERFYRTPTL